ncbi:MAG: VWA domain-containing protein, partial [Flammeovirgaceae bacterium]|nr:VWA domain-containing protein [Flammeovirgaceae bacterium]MDW8288517.1 vWA domain-containing protein [Flammeovirgaceae bacterium]
MPRTWLNDSTLTFFEQKVEADKKYGHLYSIASNKLEELNLKTYFEVCMKSPDMKWIVSWKLDEKKIKQIALQSSMKKEVYFAENITPLLYSPDSRLLFVEKIINNKNYYGFIFTSDFLNNQRKVYKFADVPLSRDGEPVSGEDPLPPDNYKYFFSKLLKVYDPTLRGEIYAFVFKNLVIDDNKKANLSFSWHDTLGNQYTKMTTLNFRQHICEVNLIRENKQKIPVSDWKITEHYDDGPSLIVLVLDHSGSMGDERALVMQEGVKKLIENKRPKDSIALIRYDSKVKVFSKPSVDKDYLLERNPLNGLEGFGSSTALLDGTHRAVRGLSKESSNQKRAILLITDGFENSSFVTENDVIREAIKYNVPIYTIGFGYYVDVDLLTQLAESTQGTYYQIYSTDFLLDIFEDIYKKMSYYYTLSFDVPSMQENYILQVKFCKKNLGIFEVPLNPKKKPVEEDEFFLGETFEEEEVISLKEGETLEIRFGF